MNLQLDELPLWWPGNYFEIERLGGYEVIVAMPANPSPFDVVKGISKVSKSWGYDHGHILKNVGQGRFLFADKGDATIFKMLCG